MSMDWVFGAPGCVGSALPVLREPRRLVQRCGCVAKDAGEF